MKLFLGVDGDQSSTMAVIGLRHDGPCHHVKSDAKGREAISEEAKL